MSGRRARTISRGTAPADPAVSGPVEFLNALADDPGGADSSEPLVQSARHWTLSAVAALVAAGLVGVMTFQAGTEEAVPPTPPPTPPLTVGTTMVTVAPGPEGERLGDEFAGRNGSRRVTRTDGHDPYVLGVPGLGEPLEPSLVDHALLYVNTSGRATVLDLTTGDREEVEIAEERDSDSFLLEFGHVVIRDWGAAGERTGSDRSIAIRLHRTAPGGDVPAFENSSDVDLRLCLDTGGCTLSSTVAPALTLGVDSIEAVSIPSGGNRAEAIADLLGVAVVIEGRWLVTDDFRLPAPLDTTAIWLVHQPVSTEVR